MTVTFRQEKFFSLVLLIGILATFFALALYAYLGTFSRYGSDDYCLTAFFYRDGSLAARMVDRYVHSSSRYTNILFIGFVDKIFGWYNVAVLPGLMVALFVVGFYLLVKQIGQIAPLGWDRASSLFIAVLIVYFSILQAPNLYETLYWRAGMTSHFAPLVFMSFLGVFVLRQIENTRRSKPARLTLMACFVLAFVIGGFSEPPVTLLITVLVLAMIYAGWKADTSKGRAVLFILGWTLAGASLALATLALAPANSLRLGNSTPGFLELFSKSFRYSFDFVLDTLRSFPVPTLVSILFPTVLGLVKFSNRPLSHLSRRQLWLALILSMVVAFIMIAASFAPSVYGQNFPIARARFAGRVILTSELLFAGAALGLLIANIELRLLQTASFNIAISLLFLPLVLYPIWTTLRVMAAIPEFRQRAEIWDERDKQIRAMKQQGIQDVVIPRLPTEVIQDLQDRTRFRLNRCASLIYGVNTILAVNVEK